MIVYVILANVFLLSCTGLAVDVNFSMADCYNIGDNLILNATWNGTGTVFAVRWYYYSIKINSSSVLSIPALTCNIVGTPDIIFNLSRMTFNCSLGSNKFQATILNLEKSEIGSVWGVGFRLNNVATEPVLYKKTVVRCVVKPDQPTGLQYFNVTETSVDLQWTPGAGDVEENTTFVIQYQQQNESVWQHVNSTSAFCTLTGLQRGTAYLVQVYAFNTAGSSNTTGPIQFTTNAATSYSWSPQTVLLPPEIEITDENNVNSTVNIEYSLTNLKSSVQSSINVVQFTGTGRSTTHTLKGLKWVRKYYLAIYVVNKDGTTSNKQYYEVYSGGWLGVLIIVLGWIIINIILVMIGMYTKCMLCAFGCFHGQPLYKIVLLNIACIFVVGWIYILIVACIAKTSKKDEASCFKMNTIFPNCKDQTSAVTFNNDGAGRSTAVSKTDIHLKETTVSPRPLSSKPPASESLDKHPLKQILRSSRSQPFPPADDHAKTMDILMPTVDVKTLPPISAPFLSSVDESGETKKHTKKKKKITENKDQLSPSKEDDEQ